MKKFLAIFAIAGAMTACNNSGDANNTTDSTHVDSSNASVAPVTDSTHMGDSAHMMTDSSKMSKDSTKK
jgi:hypothetical protein